MIYRCDPLLGLTFPIHRAIILRETRSLGNEPFTSTSAIAAHVRHAPPRRNATREAPSIRGTTTLGGTMAFRANQNRSEGFPYKSSQPHHFTSRSLAKKQPSSSSLIPTRSFPQNHHGTNYKPLEPPNL